MSPIVDMERAVFHSERSGVEESRYLIDLYLHSVNTRFPQLFYIFLQMWHFPTWKKFVVRGIKNVMLFN